MCQQTRLLGNQHPRRQLDEGDEAVGQLAVAGGDAPVLFQMGEEIFHLVPKPVAFLVLLDRGLPVRPGRDRGLDV